MENKVIAGRYALIKIIGQGGMADVYLAMDTILERQVAIKILRSNLADDALYVQRFAREASAAAALSHRNIVEIYDVGEDEGQYYIVMEYVPGFTLKDLIRRRGALHISEAVDVMGQLLAGVYEAHQNGVIHRDIKPQNILMTESGVLKIGDFGIAMIQSFVQVTDTSTVMGSLHYLAPEIIRGEKATNQSDIYALGIIFYELLRGDVPFNDEVALNIAMKHLKDEMPSIREFNPTISQAIENVIIKATAKNSKDRYENAHDMLYDMQMALKYPDQPKLVFEAAPSEPTIVAKMPADAMTQSFAKTTKTMDVVKVQQVASKVEEAPKKKRLKPQVIILGLVVVATIIGGVVMYFLNKNQPITMPDLSGLTIEEARVELEKYALVLDESTIAKENSNKYKEGEIIKTSPSFNSEVKKGSSVVVTISQGQLIKVGDYVNKSFEQARTSLENMGIKVVVEHQKSSTVKKDCVISQSIEKNTILANNQGELSIKLVVSDGYSVHVDSVVGLSLEEAKAKLEGKDIRYETVKLEGDIPVDAKSNVVYKQSYEDQDINDEGIVITLYYYEFTTVEELVTETTEEITTEVNE